MKLVLALLLLTTQFSFGSKASAFEAGKSHRITRFTQTRELPNKMEYFRQALVTPSEYAPATELQMTHSIFSMIAKQLVGTVDRTATILVVVESKSEANDVLQEYKDVGGDPSRVRPLITKYNSIWYQDYGPIYSIDLNRSLVANDFIYNRFGRYQDDKLPAVVALAEKTGHRDVTMNYEGGNFVSDGHGSCFASTRMYEQNPQLKHEQVDQLMKANLGCEKMITLTPLQEDDTFHIDLFAKMVDDHTFFVGDFLDRPTEKKIMDDNARKLQGLGYTVYRLPVRSTSAMNHRTHINTFLINGYAIMPTYGIPEDDVSASMYEKVGFKVLKIEANWFEHQGGALHCVLRSKPAVN